MSFMNEYQRLGHMRPVPASKIHRKDVYYLPHHAIFKASSSIDKIRVVFNAFSSRTSTGFTLNDLLLPGPKLQSELWLILTRWRFYRYVFTTDIVKMFRQILVHPQDVDMQRILWRPDPVKEEAGLSSADVYVMTSAPYLALRMLMQLADDERSVYPLGSAVIKILSYVDDILAGGHTLDHALETQRQLVALLASGGFDLSKWAA